MGFLTLPSGIHQIDLTIFLIYMQISLKIRNQNKIIKCTLEVKVCGKKNHLEFTIPQPIL